MAASASRSREADARSGMASPWPSIRIGGFALFRDIEFSLAPNGYA